MQVDRIIGQAAREAATSFFNHVGYNQANNAANLAAYEGDIEMSRHSVYRTVNLSKSQRESAAKEAAAIGHQAGENVRKRLEREKAAPVVKELRSKAADWRQRALDGRWAGMDREVQALLIRKASEAEAQADAIEAGEGRDSEEAKRLDADAAEHDKRATDTRLSPDIRAYYRDRAREARNRASSLRGLSVHEEDKPSRREIYFRV